MPSRPHIQWLRRPNRSRDEIFGWILARPALRAQPRNPTGPAGHIATWLLGRRSSNVTRNRWAVELLDIQPTDRVLELGCGPGVAVAAIAARANRGRVVGVDRSDVAISQASRRNRAAISEGRVRLVHAPVEDLCLIDGPFDAALAVNTVGMWPEPVLRLREIAGQLRSGGRIALVSQPRGAGASAATAGERLAVQLRDAGFQSIRVERLDLDPPAVCVLAERS